MQKEKNKKYLSKKQDKKKTLDVSPTMRVNTTNLNSTDGSKRKNSNLIVRYNYSKKCHFFRNYNKPKKDLKN